MFSDSRRHFLKELAKKSITYGLKHKQPLPIDLSALDDEFTVPRATFVTLQKYGQLRGCIGMLEASRPLADDIAHNSYAAAFTDPRFPPVTEDELEELNIHISILNPAELIYCTSEAELLTLLRPNIDGLILDDGIHKATFLPSVWESLPDPADFVHNLKIKAGLKEHYWSASLRAYRYTTESF
ncbi:MAG: AmmeMemoRadiSam system protein A [Pseudomonadota bacterium]|nr:AmmeMemoRadiSam system protein A [Pseudomonadota bacterium]